MALSSYEEPRIFKTEFLNFHEYLTHNHVLTLLNSEKKKPYLIKISTQSPKTPAFTQRKGKKNKQKKLKFDGVKSSCRLTAYIGYY